MSVEVDYVANLPPKKKKKKKMALCLKQPVAEK